MKGNIQDAGSRPESRAVSGWRFVAPYGICEPASRSLLRLVEGTLSQVRRCAPSRIRTCAHGSEGESSPRLLAGETRPSRPAGERVGMTIRLRIHTETGCERRVQQPYGSR